MRHLNLIIPAAVCLVALMVSDVAFAQAAEHVESLDYKGMMGLGAGLAVGFAVIGGGIGQGLSGRAACEGVARNPQASGKILTQAIVALAMTESLVLLAFVISLALLFA